MKDLIDRKAGRMKLIDAPVGVFVFHDELVLKTEYMTNIDGVYIPDCYILSTGEKFCGGMKSKEDFKTKYNDLDVEVIDIMPSAHLESKQQATVSSDCISRQDAKDVVDMELDAIDHVPEWVYDRLLTALDKVPSAQPDIIRCKECKHWRQQTNYQGVPLSFGFCESDDMWRSLYGEICEVSHIDTDDDFYFGYAERRTDDKTNKGSSC